VKASPLHVLVIGGGIGGLCLAQGLKRNGVSVAVYERDRSPDARLQGYRLNIEPVGSRALHACLPVEVWNLLVATAGDPGPRMGVFDEHLRELMQEDEPEAAADPVNAHHAVSRVTLRRLLLAGLDDVVHFDKQFIHFEQSSTEMITAFFADGTTAAGHILVGADGARSRVRRQLLPSAGEVRIGAVGIGGKVPITEETARWLPEHIVKTKNMILPPQDFLFTAAFRRRKSPSDLMRDISHDLRAVGMDPGRGAEGNRAGRLRHVGVRRQPRHLSGAARYARPACASSAHRAADNALASHPSAPGGGDQGGHRAGIRLFSRGEGQAMEHDECDVARRRTPLHASRRRDGRERRLVRCESALRHIDCC